MDRHGQQGLKAQQAVSAATIVAGIAFWLLAIFITKEPGTPESRMVVADWMLRLGTVLFVIGAAWWITARIVYWWKS